MYVQVVTIIYVYVADKLISLSRVRCILPDHLQTETLIDIDFKKKKMLQSGCSPTCYRPNEVAANTCPKDRRKFQELLKNNNDIFRSFALYGHLVHRTFHQPDQRRTSGNTAKHVHVHLPRRTH